MVQRVFVKVIGFSDVERHALNTVFRLSEGRGTVYSLWLPEAPDEPKLALIDGQSPDSAYELASPLNAGLQLIWVGPVSPARAWRTFQRPLAWPDVVAAMDELFAPAGVLDFDLDDATHPAALLPDGGSGKRALIASADRDERLYLRARLALAGLTQADEAETGARALELTREHAYAVALVDFSLPDVNAWSFLRELSEHRPRIGKIIMTKTRPSLGERVRARFGGANACFEKPPHPGKLRDLLEGV
jgi:CheY-like chemotaxis protein